MAQIYVRTKPGRVARTAPRGDLIPTDRFIAVQPSAYIDRLINIHGDIEVQPSKAPVERKQTDK